MPKKMLIVPVVGYDRVLDDRMLAKKMRLAYEKPRFRFADHKGKVYVESETTPERWYEIDPDAPTCSCPAFHRAHQCKHLHAYNERPPRLGPQLPWVAKITGTHPIFDWKREFVRGDLDFRNANKSGSRGVRMFFVVAVGAIYEVFEHTGYAKSRRYFVRIESTGPEEICESDLAAQL